MRLRSHLERVRDTIYSRRELVVERLRVEELSPGRLGAVEGRLRFYDGSLLDFDETIVTRGVVLVKTHYAYHYQHADGSLIFRYDNAPHHPELPGFPCHKHTPAGVQPAEAPDLSEVLREIDGLLYPDREER